MVIFILGDVMKKEIRKQLDDKKKSSNKIDFKWCFSLMIVAFIISILLSFISEIAMKDVNLLVGTLVILIFISIGVLFDTIGVAVTSADEAPFHAMSSKKIKGARKAVSLKKNSAKVSSFCCDVVGDICGIVSGAAGVVVAARLSSVLGISSLFSSLLVAGFIAALTIGGKAVEKAIAINNGNKILYEFAKILSIFGKY